MTTARILCPQVSLDLVVHGQAGRFDGLASDPDGELVRVEYHEGEHDETTPGALPFVVIDKVFSIATMYFKGSDGVGMLIPRDFDITTAFNRHQIEDMQVRLAAQLKEEE